MLTAHEKTISELKIGTKVKLVYENCPNPEDRGKKDIFLQAGEVPGDFIFVKRGSLDPVQIGFGYVNFLWMRMKRYQKLLLKSKK